MTSFKKIILSSLGGLALLTAVGGAAHAGFKYNPILVSNGGSSASGLIASVRASSDTSQYIGCYVSVTGSPAAPTLICYANSSTNVYRSCSTTNTAFLSAVNTMTPNSYIYFAWDANAKCTNVLIENGSAMPVTVN